MSDVLQTLSNEGVEGEKCVKSDDGERKATFRENNHSTRTRTTALSTANFSTLGSPHKIERRRTFFFFFFFFPVYPPGVILEIEILKTSKNTINKTEKS